MTNSIHDPADETSTARQVAASRDEAAAGVVVVQVAGRPFAILAEAARSLDAIENLHRVPQSPPWIAGLAELDGKISTVIDLRPRLGFGPRVDFGVASAVTIDVEGFLYSLLVDEIGDVVSLPSRLADSDLPDGDALWTIFVAGSFSLGAGRSLPILDVEALVRFEHEKDGG